jgi:hypothetical protein
MEIEKVYYACGTLFVSNHIPCIICFDEFSLECFQRAEIKSGIYRVEFIDESDIFKIFSFPFGS